ncbi:MAG: very short patch repair endonuclease [Hyphomonadaceae bacterium]
MAKSPIPSRDPFTPEKRSAIMRAIKGRDTKPELIVRRAAHALGYRYSLKRRDLPGKPDLAFVSRRKAVFVHGCFWHGHACKRGARVPAANAAYWSSKIARNRVRDGASAAALEALGWSSLTLWECELADSKALAKKLSRFLG